MEFSQKFANPDSNPPQSEYLRPRPMIKSLPREKKCRLCGPSFVPPNRETRSYRFCRRNKFIPSLEGIPFGIRCPAGNEKQGMSWQGEGSRHRADTPRGWSWLWKVAEANTAICTKFHQLCRWQLGQEKSKIQKYIKIAIFIGI